MLDKITQQKTLEFQKMYRIVTIFHYLAVTVAELDCFETCGFLLLRHNVNYVLQTCFRALRHLVPSSVFDSFFLLHNSVNLVRSRTRRRV